MREKVMLHAVVRLDRVVIDTDAAGAADVEQAVAVVAVLPTREEAEELARLMRLRDDDDLSLYIATSAPYYPGGRGAQP